jgi:hypothetical protein
MPWFATSPTGPSFFQWIQSTGHEHVPKVSPSLWIQGWEAPSEGTTFLRFPIRMTPTFPPLITSLLRRKTKCICTRSTVRASVICEKCFVQVSHSSSPLYFPVLYYCFPQGIHVTTLICNQLHIHSQATRDRNFSESFQVLVIKYENIFFFFLWD